MEDDEMNNDVQHRATRMVQIREDDAHTIIGVLSEKDEDRGQPTHRDPLLHRYAGAIGVLNDAIADRAR